MHPRNLHLYFFSPTGGTQRVAGLFAENLNAADACTDITVHAEAAKHLNRVLHLIREAGCLAGVALNPATSPDCLRYSLGAFDLALVMTVNPGFAGQKAVPETIAKIHETRELLAKHGLAHLPIEVDGNCSFEMAPKMRAQSADIFVCGSSSVFTKSMPMDEAIAKFRECVK